MTATTGQCRVCASGEHRWSVPSHESFYLPSGQPILLYRWICFCVFCSRRCQARRVRVCPNPPPEVDVNPTVTIKVPNLVTQQPDHLPVRERQEGRFPGKPFPSPSREMLDKLRQARWEEL